MMNERQILHIVSLAEDEGIGGSFMGLFKDLKGESKTDEEFTKDTKLDAADNNVDQSTTNDTQISEDYLDEDMYKDILAAAELILTDDSNHSESMTDHSDDKNANKSELEASNQEEYVEGTMVDYDENAVNSEILDTLLKEEKVESQVQVKEEPVKHTPNAELAKEDKEAVTVITKGTTIHGSIISDCSLDVMGTINGDIECLGKLTISGKVTGNSMASEVYVNTERLEGCISSEGSVKIGQGTVVIGDITATSGVIAGAVKGEVDISGPVVIDSTAIIKGNVKAKSVQMNNGAVLEGFCSLSYSDVNINDIFE